VPRNLGTAQTGAGVFGAQGRVFFFPLGYIRYPLALTNHQSFLRDARAFFPLGGQPRPGVSEVTDRKISCECSVVQF
jgi:hypothetical protein